jgi:N utilization substance protein A
MPQKNVKFGKDEMDLIKMFDAVTGAGTLDCVIMSDKPEGEENPAPGSDRIGSERIVFMVKYTDLAQAIGKAGVNVKKLKEKLGKDIDIIAFSDDLNRFIKNLLYPAKINLIEEQKRNDGKKIMMVTVEAKDKGLAIGKNGRNIVKANIFVRRHFDVDGIMITQ